MRTHWGTTARASSQSTHSMWKPPLVKFPLTPTAPNSTTTTHPPTTQERPLETTVEMGSLATNSSPSTTPFRFTSFPASLPRVQHPLRDAAHALAPDSVRKRMFPPSTHHSTAAVPPMNQSREEDGTQNTSISSLSTHGEEDPRMPPVHTRLFEDEDVDLEYRYSDDDDDCTGLVGRTRLNFNLMLSPKMPMQKDESPFKEIRETSQKDVFKTPSQEPEDATAPTVLSRPYEQLHVHSFPSTMSSHTPLRSLSGCDDVGTASTSGLTTSRGDPPLDATATHQLHHSRVPQTPEEVQLHFQFDSVQCSPIPGIPEEEELRCRPAVRAGKNCPRLPPKPHQITGTSATANTSSAEVNLPALKSSMNIGKEVQQDDVRLSFSQESISSSASAKQRRFRPMPDMAAFEMDSCSKNGQDKSTENMSGRTPPPKLLCPPTPVRTPVWAHTSDDSSASGERPLLHHHRSNSLIVTRVLATCSPQIMDSIEGSSLAASNKSNVDAAMEIDTGTSASRPLSHLGTPQHPEAPPAIRRSVGEMGSIVSFAADFETLGILGKGAFADVYKVRCNLNGRLYAVKRNRRHFRGKRDRDIALAEVRSMQHLQQQDHQHHLNNSLQYLLFFYRAWQEDGHFFCQTELCCRHTCRELMDSLSHEWSAAQKRYPSLLRNTSIPDGVAAGLDVKGRLIPNATLWKICHDICAGLSHIHSRGLVHNDIKPENVFLTLGERGFPLCKIGDFGMTGAIGTSEDGQEGDSIYMAPELLSSSVKHASADIFSLGLTMYELSAGHGFELPKQGPRWHELRNGCHIPHLPPPRDSILAHLIQQMISAAEQKRPRAADVLKHEKIHSGGDNCDKFLHDYIKDIEEYDRREEELRAVAEQVGDDEQTPRMGANGFPCRSRVLGRVCSPTLGLTRATPNMFTPEAQ